MKNFNGNKKMIKIESSSSNNRSKRIRTTITFILAFSVAAFVASGVSYAAKPAPALNATVCSRIGGVWTPSTCTIPEGTVGVVSSGFTINNGVKLDIRGSLTIPAGLTVTNASSGTIIVENAGGVIPTNGVAPTMPFHDWETGLLVLGTLANSGTITVQNVYDGTNLKPQGTEGITISVSFSATDPADLSTYAVVPGVLTNSGTITIQNGDQTRGIEILGTIDNSSSGTIIVANIGTGSAGIYNKRFGGSQMYIDGTMTNAGSIIISSSGDSNGPNGVQYSYGIYNQGLFTISDTGTFTILPSPITDDSRGLYNGGSFTNYGTVTNDRGSFSEGDDSSKANWGSYNEAGTMINYGTTYAKGTFYNNLVMLQYGTVTSSGTFDDETGHSMINYGTFYNSGLILGGKNRGICIDKSFTDGTTTTYIGNGCR